MTWCFKERGPGYHWIVDLYSHLGLPICPRYTAQRNLLLTSTARILGETWSSSSDARKIIDINCTLFREVQTFIIITNRFLMATVGLFNYTFLVMLI